MQSANDRFSVFQAVFSLCKEAVIEYSRQIVALWKTHVLSWIFFILRPFWYCIWWLSCVPSTVRLYSFESANSNSDMATPVIHRVMQGREINSFFLSGDIGPLGIASLRDIFLFPIFDVEAMHIEQAVNCERTLPSDRRTGLPGKRKEMALNVRLPGVSSARVRGMRIAGADAVARASVRALRSAGPGIA